MVTLSNTCYHCYYLLLKSWEKMDLHRFILEPYKGMNTRYQCPQCKRKTFVRCIDTVTGEHIHPTVGRCNREINCGYHLTPKQYFQDNNLSFDKCDSKQLIKVKTDPPIQKQVSIIQIELFKASLNHYEKNNFVKFLIDLFGINVTKELISKYFIGTSRHWDGATVFWQIDISGKVRTGKIMLYSPITGKRVKEPFNHITWVHTALKQPEFELKQCFFGEHLLHDKTKPIALVESEKTAIISSVYLPQFIWLAVGSLNNLNAEKCQVLKGRIVTLFPDLNGFEKWSNKARELSNLAIFTVSDLLERKATNSERQQGFDLADYLIKFDPKEFLLQAPKPISAEQPPAMEPLIEVNRFEPVEQVFFIGKPETLKPENWDQEIAELELFFKTAIIPTKPLKMNPWETITDISQFIDCHFAVVNANNGNKTFLPDLNRLKELKNKL